MKDFAEGDSAEATAENKAAAFERALEAMEDQRLLRKSLRKASEALEEEYGEDSPQYTSAYVAFHKQKAVFRQWKQLLSA